MFAQQNQIDVDLTQMSSQPKFLSFSLVKPDWVYSHACGVFAFDTYDKFALLQSNFHNSWVRNYASSLETRLRYSPADVFLNFPFPEIVDQKGVQIAGEDYHIHRNTIMMNRQEGLTKTYNRFHTLSEQANDILQLRELHVRMDNAVAAVYGWDDLALDHGFHETAQGIRFTISEAARREVLQRLLKLNHQRYAEEVAAGLHDRKKKGARGKGRGTKKKVAPEQKTLF